MVGRPTVKMIEFQKEILVKVRYELPNFEKTIINNT